LDENFSVLAHYDKAGKDESLLLSQIIGDKKLPFDDVRILKEFLEEKY
jgi:hypothetical protein